VTELNVCLDDVANQTLGRILHGKGPNAQFNWGSASKGHFQAEGAL